MEKFKKKINESFIYDKKLYPNFPKRMLMEITNACNHECIFCAHKKMKRKIGYINKDLAFNILKEAYKLGTREVGFYSTGEPFISKNLCEFIADAKKNGYEYIYITTNGALITPGNMEKVFEAGLDSIKFSINAGTQETYKLIHGKDDFINVIDNIKYVYEYRKRTKGHFNIFVSYVRTKQNINECDLLYNLIHSYVDEIVYVDAYNQGGNMYEINDGIMLNDIENLMTFPCYMLFNQLHVTCEGYLNICCVDFDNYLAVEDLNIVSIEEAWFGEKFASIRKKHIEKDIEGTMCYNCIYNTNKLFYPLNEELQSNSIKKR